MTGLPRTRCRVASRVLRVESSRSPFSAGDGPHRKYITVQRVQTTASHGHYQSSSSNRRPWGGGSGSGGGGIQQRARCAAGLARAWRKGVVGGSGGVHDTTVCTFFFVCEPSPQSLGRSSPINTVSSTGLLARQLSRLLSLTPSTAHHDIHVVRTAKHMPAARTRTPPAGRGGVLLSSCPFQPRFFRRGRHGGLLMRGLGLRCRECGCAGAARRLFLACVVVMCERPRDICVPRRRTVRL